LKAYVSKTAATGTAWSHPDRTTPILKTFSHCCFWNEQYRPDGQCVVLPVTSWPLQPRANNHSVTRWLVPHSRITSTKGPSFCMTPFSASLTNLTVLLPFTWLQKNTDPRAYDFRHSRTCNVSSPTIPEPEARDFVELILLYQCMYNNPLTMSCYV